MSDRKRPLHESDLDTNNNPPKKVPKAEPAQDEPKYHLLQKPDLEKQCTARGLIKTGCKSDLIDRLKSADKARKDKYANAENAPFSKEEAAKHPIGAKVPPSPSRASFGKNDPEAEILRRGPSGPPVYDEMGFELDYNKVAKGQRRRPGCKSRNHKKYNEFLEQSRRERERQAQIMGTDAKKTSALTLMAWTDRVSRDLGIPYHAVDLQDFEEWHRRAFKAEGEEFEAENISEEERGRLLKLATGSAFRK